MRFLVAFVVGLIVYFCVSTISTIRSNAKLVERHAVLVEANTKLIDANTRLIRTNWDIIKHHHPRFRKEPNHEATETKTETE